jgi:hypothetical protein
LDGSAHIHFGKKAEEEGAAKEKGGKGEEEL